MLSAGYVVSWICCQLDMLSAGYVVSWICCQLDMLSAGYVVSWICCQLDMLSAGYVILGSTLQQPTANSLNNILDKCVHKMFFPLFHISCGVRTCSRVGPTIPNGLH